MDPRLIPIEGSFRSNHGLFRAALDGLGAGDVAWQERSGQANHLAFLAVHLVGARYWILGFLGVEAADPLEPYHGKARSIEDMDEFPPPDEVREAWEDVGPRLEAALAAAPPRFLREAHGVPFPTPGPTRLDALAFLAQHEAYHLGQMALIRRIHGLPPAEWPRFSPPEN